MTENSIVAGDMAHIVRMCQQELKHLSGRSLLITGASGFIGRYLLESLVAWHALGENESCQLYLPTRSLHQLAKKWPHYLDIPNLHWFEWDGSCLDHVPCVDYVVHAASPVEPHVYLPQAYLAMQAMVTMTDTVLRYCQKHDVIKLLYLSSGAVYGRIQESMTAIPESYQGVIAMDDPRSCYAETKRYCEMLVRLSGVPSVVARLFSFLGPYMDLNASYAVSNFIKTADQQGCVVLHSDGLALRTYGYASDLSVMLWKLLVHAPHQSIYNVGGDFSATSILKLAHDISEVMHVPLQHHGQGRQVERACYVPDMAKMRVLYQGKIPLNVAIARTLSAMQSQALLNQSSNREVER